MHNANPAPGRPPRGPLKGTAQVPGDESISQRALILGGTGGGRNPHYRPAGIRRRPVPPPGPCRPLGADLTQKGPAAWRVTGTWVSGTGKAPTGTGFRQFRHRLAAGDGRDGDHADHAPSSPAMPPCARVPWRGWSSRSGVRCPLMKGRGQGADAADRASARKDAPAVNVTVATASAAGEIGAAAGGAQCRRRQPHHPGPR